MITILLFVGYLVFFCFRSPIRTLLTCVSDQEAEIELEAEYKTSQESLPVDTEAQDSDADSPPSATKVARGKTSSMSGQICGYRLCTSVFLRLFPLFILVWPDHRLYVTTLPFFSELLARSYPHWFSCVWMSHQPKEEDDTRASGSYCQLLGSDSHANFVHDAHERVSFQNSTTNATNSEIPQRWKYPWIDLWTMLM